MRKCGQAPPPMIRLVTLHMAQGLLHNHTATNWCRDAWEKSSTSSVTFHLPPLDLATAAVAIAVGQREQVVQTVVWVVHCQPQQQVLQGLLSCSMAAYS